MDYSGNTDEQRKEMLKTIGVDKVENLFDEIPSEYLDKAPKIPAGKSEMWVRAKIEKLAAKNAADLVSFLGAGFYDHYVPSAVDSILRRGEFFTAYTPYQPEASQGTLQVIYEYQTAICRLTDMDASNASLYDGGTALYEAAMMAARATRRKKIVLDGGVSPIYRSMLDCYTRNLNLEFAEIPAGEGVTDRKKIAELIDDKTAAVVLQNPNFFGFIDDYSDIVEMAHEAGALAIMSCYPIALGMLKTPGEMGVDIATGEGQSLGIPLSFGGPYLGFMATRKKFVRNMPGRIVGTARDDNGRRGFVLTLQTREQHIRRHRATSNICTNEALCALAAQVYMSLVGKEGLKEVAQLSADKAEYAAERLEAIPGIKINRSSAFFNEFVCELPVDAGMVITGMLEKGFAAGFPLGRYSPGNRRHMLVAVTEKRTREDIGAFAEALEGFLDANI